MSGKHSWVMWHQVCKGSHRLTLPQLLLGTVEVKVDIETLHKLCDGVLVGVGLLWEGQTSSRAAAVVNMRLHQKLWRRYLLNDLDQVLENLSALPHVFVGDDCSREVSQNVRAHGLDGI